jgi:hypothetical protein
MSDRSQVVCGTVAAGVRSGSRSIFRGTSMAAPFVARQLATAFVSASDGDVRRAEGENYLALLHRYELSDRRRKTRQEKDRQDRLGKILVPPHWQPGTAFNPPPRHPPRQSPPAALGRARRRRRAPA